MEGEAKTTILIVDDDDNFTTVTGAFLKSQGYHVHSASTGREALERVSEGLEIVLLDLILPDAEGVEILRRIRQMDQNLAVITVTGYGDEHRAVDVMKAGSCDYLSKPFRFKDLIQSIEKARLWREIQIIENLSEGYLAIESGKVIYANRMAYDLLGYSRDEMFGLGVSRLFPREEAIRFQRHKGQPEKRWRTCELKAVHKEGATHTLEARVGNDSFQRREIVAVFFKDITATKHLESALQETQTLYENLILNANDGITLIHPRGTFSLVNPKFCELSGYSREEARDLHYSNLIHPEDLPLFTDRFRRSLDGEEVPSSYQFRIVRKTGEILFVDFNVNVIRKDGKIIGIQAIARDITERKRSEKELQERMKELEKWHKLTVDRELRMIELKERIEELECQLAHLKKLKGVS